jgi:hypothetical protein
MAARLQKLQGVQFAFNRRGIAVDQEDASVFFKEDTVVKRVSIRGIGEGELVGILKSDFNAMNQEEKKAFRAL